MKASQMWLIMGVAYIAPHIPEDIATWSFLIFIGLSFFNAYKEHKKECAEPQ